MSSERLRLSPSALDLLQLCGEAFRRRYILGERERRTTVDTIIGSATHYGAELDLTWKIQLGTLLPSESIRDVAADAFEETWRDQPPEDTDRRERRGPAKDTSIALVELYHDMVAPTFDPAAVEQYHHAELSGFPMDLHGYIDVVEQGGDLRDLKTRKASTSGAAASVQGEVYSLLRELATGQKPGRFSVDTLVKKKVPTVITDTVTPTGDHSAITQRLERAALVVQSGAFMPADPSHWKCSAKYCEYFGSCAFGQRRRVSIGVNETGK